METRLADYAKGSHFLLRRRKVRAGTFLLRRSQSPSFSVCALAIHTGARDGGEIVTQKPTINCYGTAGSPTLSGTRHGLVDVFPMACIYSKQQS